MDLTKAVNAQKLCEQLIAAETESDVIDTLTSARLWDRYEHWVPYGGMEMNRSIVGNQQSSPVAALVEKLVNSLDAVLTCEAICRGISPRSAEAPQTMIEAVQRFFSVPDGRIQNLTASARTRLAEKIQLVATGPKKNPNYTIVDEGEGQHPDAFANTFLSLLRENKSGIRFVQGKFNMGGTGVLQFAGRESFQLIVSRRNTEIFCAEHGTGTENPWGFTIVRRINPGDGKPHSRYVYLAPAGRVPRFNADSIEVRPAEYPHATSRALESGSVIKLWNFKVPGGLKTNLMFDMRRALERHLPEPVLPIRLYERRAGYNAHSYETTMSGLSSVIADNPEDIEGGLDTGSQLSIQGVGVVDVRLTVVREEAVTGSNPKYPRGGIFFNVNGQLHSELDSGFVSRRTKLDYIASTTLVTVDCTSLSERLREDLFLGSRDRMRECEERDRLYDALADYLRDHGGLRELNARRRQERMAAAVSDEETTKIVQDLVKADPTLAALFGKGTKIKIPIGPEPVPVPYEGKRFPTYFRITNEPKDGLVKRCPRNRKFRITFETDAANDYFSRMKDRGRYATQGSPNLASVHLWDGVATFTFDIPQHCAPRDVLNVAVEVMDVSRIEPFASSFRVEVEQDAPPREPGGLKPPSGAFFSGLPKIKEVRRAEWNDWSFDERSALALRANISEDGEQLDIAVNIDNIYLQNEKDKRRSSDPRMLEYWFKYGLFLLALGMLHDHKTRKPAESNEALAEPGAFEDIGKACRGLAITVIPVIEQLSKERDLARV